MTTQETTIGATISLCTREIKNTITELQSLAIRLAAMESTFTAMEGHEASYYRVTFYNIATALREPHLSMSYAKQEIDTLERLARNRSAGH